MTLTPEQSLTEIKAVKERPTITWREIAQAGINTMPIEERYYMVVYIATYFGIELTATTTQSSLEMLLMKQMLNN